MNGIAVIETRGDKAGVLTGTAILGVLFVAELVVGWGFTRRPVWILTGLIVGIVMLGTATAVDRYGSHTE